MPRRTSKVSEKKRLANRRNAQKSTGPKTPQGKARSKMNAITHGLFCQEVCFLKEPRPLFIELRRQFIRDLRPQSLLELSFVDAIVENHWKLRRLRISEALAHEEELRGYLDDQKKDFDAEMKSRNDPDYCAIVATVRMMQREPDNLEKYSRHQQRLWNMIHRAMKELRTCRENQAAIEALPRSPFEASVDDIPYGIEDGKTLEEIYNPRGERAESEEQEVDEEIEVENESAERSQPISQTSPSSLPLTSHENAGTPAREEGEMQNEATEFRNYDADTTCDPSWALPKPALTFGDPRQGG